MVSPKSLPPCGLFRTTKALAGGERDCPAGLLVYFHNHGEGGFPHVIPPDHNVHNRWHFHGPGLPVRARAWVDTLVRLPSQGFCMLRKDLDFDGGSWPKGSLVQLGYSRAAEPILFIAQQRASLAENDLFFSDMGVKVAPARLEDLAPLTVFVE